MTQDWSWNCQKTAKKSYSLQSRKRQRITSALYEVFLDPQHSQHQCVAGVSTLSFKINTSLFCCPRFFKEDLNPCVRIKKMANENIVNSHCLIFLENLQGFIPLQKGCSIFYSSFICHSLGNILKHMVFRLPRNAFAT